MEAGLSSMVTCRPDLASSESVLDLHEDFTLSL